MKASFFCLLATALSGVAAIPFESSSRPSLLNGRAWKKPSVTDLIEAALGVKHALGLDKPPNDPSLPAVIQPLPAQFFPEAGSKRVKVRYGPYTSRSVLSGGIELKLLNEPGMSDTGEYDATKPCTDCMLTYMHAGLEYSNGTDANIDSGMWLHHMVFFNNGPGRQDTVCPGNKDERFFSSGNERSPTDMTNNGTLKNGYYIKPTDRWWIMLELMNMNPDNRKIYLTVTYEYVPQHPPDFHNVKAMWFDITNCGNSFQPAGNGSTFDFSMSPWKATINATGIGVGGHLHDGGSDVKIYRNQQTLCTATADYGGNPKYTQTEGTMKGLKHISYISECANPGPVNVGDEFYITAFYNLTQHPAMRNADGKLDPVMGISILYASLPLGVQ
jgi:hypothetical protein